MRFASIGSGSKGNGTLVECGRTTLLVDCGFSLRQTELRLGRLGRRIEDIDAILVTHEHSDHLSGVRRLANRYGLPVWMSVGTAREAERRAGLLDTVRLICDQQRFSIGDIEINPYPVPHDATEPLQFTFSDGAHSVGLLTDAGEVTPHIESQLRRCDALLLECNHDLELLQSGPYPYALKRRVAGRLGHLNNRQAAELLERVDTTQLQHLVVMHLSERNNCKTKALAAVSDVLGCDPEWVTLADQQEGFGWREVA